MLTSQSEAKIPPVRLADQDVKVRVLKVQRHQPIFLLQGLKNLSKSQHLELLLFQIPVQGPEIENGTQSAIRRRDKDILSGVNSLTPFVFWDYFYSPF
mgnify:CR=1 FL=1